MDAIRKDGNLSRDQKRIKLDDLRTQMRNTMNDARDSAAQ